MKKRILLFGIILTMAGQLCLATIWTVSNHPDSPGQFTDLQVAVDSASAGDTVYVSGSPNNYGVITLRKQLVLIGAGFHPDNQWEYPSRLHSIGLELAYDPYPNLVSSPAGSVITGFYIDAGIYNYPGGIDNITIARNNVGSISLGGCDDNYTTGWKIYNNICASISGDQYGYHNNIIISNNIMTGSYALQQFQTSSVLISNNLFYGSNNPLTNGSLSGSVVTNNIFYGYNIGGGYDPSYCIFNNNISYGGTYMEFIFGTNTGGGNFVNVDPEFVNAPCCTFPTNYGGDFHLMASSVGKNAGTDGTDIGIYGGMYPFPWGGEDPYQYSAPPKIPQVLEMNLQNVALPQNGTLNVQVKARKQD